MKKAGKPAPKKPVDEYPMRINKYLAVKNYATRRGGDELVSKGLVTINGHRAALGDKVEKNDTVEVRVKGKQKKFTYLAYNKPRGMITHSPQGGEHDIKEELKGVSGLADVFPVGRLDKDSHGLIILTDDARVTDRLLNPKFEHDKEYEVEVREKLRNSFKKNMEAGVDIEGYTTKDCFVEPLGESSFRIILREGKKHQIRRMVSALHNTVVDLMRVRVGTISLLGLPEGHWRPIEGPELEAFLKNLGLV